jgi:hypothetical protein
MTQQKNRSAEGVSTGKKCGLIKLRNLIIGRKIPFKGIA